MKRIGIFAKRHHEDAIQVAQEVAAWLDERKIEVLFDESLAEAMDDVKGYPAKSIPALADLIIVLGGDGTLWFHNHPPYAIGNKRWRRVREFNPTTWI